MFEGDVGENHSKQSHRGINDGHTQWEGPWDGLTNGYTQVNGRGVVLEGSTARGTVRLQLFQKKL